MEDTTNQKPKTHKKRTLLIGMCVVLILLIGGGFALWQAQKPKSMLPAEITVKSMGFTPMFYFDKIPAGYSVDTAHANFDEGVLILPLTKPDWPTIVMTQQKVSNPGVLKALQANGEKVSNVPHPATINSLEDRKLGTMIVNSRVMILLNAPGDVQKDDLKALLQQLKPVF